MEMHATNASFDLPFHQLVSSPAAAVGGARAAGHLDVTATRDLVEAGRRARHAAGRAHRGDERELLPDRGPDARWRLRLDPDARGQCLAQALHARLDRAEPAELQEAEAGEEDVAVVEDVTGLHEQVAADRTRRQWYRGTAPPGVSRAEAKTDPVGQVS